MDRDWNSVEVADFADCGDQNRNQCGRVCVVLLAAFLIAFTSTPCAIAEVTFTNVAASLGITHAQSTTAGIEGMSGGAAAADFDGDGLVDLFFTRVDAPDVLYHNTGAGFVDVSAQAGFTQALPTNGAAAADIDNDGDLDLYVTATSHGRYYLYMNDGAGHFTEEGLQRNAAVMGDIGITRRGMGVAFGDYDSDGYLDILTSDHSRPTATSGSRLLRNLGATNPGHFEDVTHAAGIDVYRQALALPNTAYRFTPQFTDLDRDGHPDIVFSSDSRTSQLFWNNGDGTFTDGTFAAGVGTDKSGMGSALADCDGDGDLDWFVSAIFDTPFVGVNPGNRLYRNNGNRTFTDVTTAAGVRNSGSGSELSWGWGTAFLDYDNDTDQDLAITNGWIALGYGGDHTTLRRNNGNGTFTDVSAAAGITDTGQGRGLLRVDYDADGDDDILIVNYGATPVLYRNDGGNSANWLNVHTAGTISNRDGIGAFIKIIPDTDHPDIFQVREITSGDSYLVQSEVAAHFGLGNFAGPVDLVEVYWPASGITQRFAGVAVNTTLLATERLPGDYNGDLRVDAADYAVWRESVGAAGANLAADGSGPSDWPDGVVDEWDYSFWRANFGVIRSSSWTPSPAIGSQTPVPEPQTAAMLAGCWCGGWLISARRGCSAFRSHQPGIVT